MIDAQKVLYNIIKLKTNYKKTHQNYELLCSNANVVADDLHLLRNNCTILISVSNFEFSRKCVLN